jgi:hypothetical protein
MQHFWSKSGKYVAFPYANEAELESSVVKLQVELFGLNRIYLDVKKKIGTKGGLRNIPDGYLIDLTGAKPRLFVVENELCAHDPLRHIAVQILEFSLSFESEPRAVKKILLEALQADIVVHKQCESYASEHQYRNLDHMLEWIVFESPFAALVIIDEIPENLESILARKFQFGVEILQLARYSNTDHEEGFHFEPFLSDLETEYKSTISISGEHAVQLTSASEIDTVVVPAHEDGFQETFLGENRWYSVRIHGSMRDQIKYIAIYRVAPISAITHLAPVKSIEPWKDSGKYVINFAEPAKAIGPIPLVKNGKIRNFQNLRYTTRDRLISAKTMDDIWQTNGV